MTIRQWVCISTSAYPRVLLAVLMLACAASCKTSLESPFKPAQGWILMKNGSLSDIGAAIRDYGGIARTKYYLEPETSNAWGDTLIGASTLGQPIRVFLPETGISEISVSQNFREEPRIQISPKPVTLEVTLDTNTAFGNPRFVVNRPMDHDRHR